MHKKFNEFAMYYDSLNRSKNYKNESLFISRLIEEYKKSKGNKLLDVGCGTGNHDVFLKQKYSILGVDLNEGMLKIARKKIKGVKFRVSDMKKLKLNQKFDVIISLFGTMNYNYGYSEFKKTLMNFHRHLNPGGVIIFDLNHTKKRFEKRIKADTVTGKGFQLTKISQIGDIKNGVMERYQIFLVKKGRKLELDMDLNKIGLFNVNRIRRLLGEMGLNVAIYCDYKNSKWKKSEQYKTAVFVAVK